MKPATTLLIALFVSMPSLAQELPIESHAPVCGNGSVEMSDEALSEMLDCVLGQRDAMGYLMDRWSSYTAELRQSCVASSRGGAAVDYVELEACVKKDA
jgi:hypothetical protein